MSDNRGYLSLPSPPSFLGVFILELKYRVFSSYYFLTTITLQFVLEHTLIWSDKILCYVLVAQVLHSLPLVTPLKQTCQPLIKENRETHEENLEILQKVVRFYLFLIKIKQTPFYRGKSLKDHWKTQHGIKVLFRRRLGTRHKNVKFIEHKQKSWFGTK